jgi:3-isopropylmalate/(R)-2-methylmalate dehydratase large subunit
MGMTIIEKILAEHSKYETVKPGDIIDVEIDTRAARDFGGANVVKNLKEYNLSLQDAGKTFFTFDCNPTGSDQKYAVNQQICRQYARQHGVRVFDINVGIGTHTLMAEGLVWPGSTVVTTDSHANIVGAIGAFGQGMGDQDIAAAWNKGKVWFKVPDSVKVTLNGKRPSGLSAKDFALNLLAIFGANKLLGYSVEFYGEDVDNLTLDERITIASMATEMGAITFLFVPNAEVFEYCQVRTRKIVSLIKPDIDARYIHHYQLDISKFEQRVSKPGKPHDTTVIGLVKKIKIDSAFLGSCTNGRIEDMRKAAQILKGRKLAPGVVLKIVPATDEIWQQCLLEGIIDIFKEAGALVSNAGCAGCAAGQVGQNGAGEVTVSSGNRNFPGKQGKGEVYLASPEIVVASAIAGYITSPDDIPAVPAIFEPKPETDKENRVRIFKNLESRPKIIEGRVWIINEDNIDTDMIFHNRYLAITDLAQMGQYTFDNLAGFEDFAKRSEPGDMVITGKNFGCGSSRQQAVDCFISLGIQAIVAQSFGAIYERNAINAALPVLTYQNLHKIFVETGDRVQIDLETGRILNLTKEKEGKIHPFYEVQMEIYQNGGLF